MKQRDRNKHTKVHNDQKEKQKHPEKDTNCLQRDAKMTTDNV